jgi:hypothetical protein
MGEVRNACIILIYIPEEKRPFGRLGHRWEDGIEMNLNGIGCEDVHRFMWLQRIS